MLEVSSEHRRALAHLIQCVYFPFLPSNPASTPYTPSREAYHPIVGRVLPLLLMMRSRDTVASSTWSNPQNEGHLVDIILSLLAASLCCHLGRHHCDTVIHACLQPTRGLCLKATFTSVRPGHALAHNTHRRTAIAGRNINWCTYLQPWRGTAYGLQSFRACTTTRMQLEGRNVPCKQYCTSGLHQHLIIYTEDVIAAGFQVSSKI